MSISPAIWLRNADTSNSVTGRRPHRPATMCSQLASRPAPSDETMPMPVMATRRSPAGRAHKSGLRLDLDRRLRGRHGRRRRAPPPRTRPSAPRAASSGPRRSSGTNSPGSVASEKLAPRIRRGTLISWRRSPTRLSQYLRDDAVDVGGELERAAVDAADAAAACRHVGQELLAGARRAPPSTSSRRGAACARRCRRRRPCRGDRASAAAELVVCRQHRAVARFDRRRRVDQQLEVALERQLALVEVERVVEGEEDAGRAQVGGDLEGVAAQRLQLAMRGLGHPPRAEVDLDAPVGTGRAVDRQPARHLFAEDHVAPVGRPARTARARRRCCRDR